MSMAQGLKAFLAALCLSATALGSASAQDTAGAAQVPQSETAVSPGDRDASQPGWLLKGRGQNRIVNPFRVTPAPGTGRAIQNQQKAGPVPLMQVPQVMAPLD